MKFLVPNYSCLQNPWLGGYRPQIPVLSVLSSTEFVEPPRTHFLGTPLAANIINFLQAEIKQRKSPLFSVIHNSTAFFNGYKGRPIVLLMCSVGTNMSIEHWRNYTENRKLDYSKNTLSQWHTVHHKSQMYWDGIEHRSLRWESVD